MWAGEKLAWECIALTETGISVEPFKTFTSRMVAIPIDNIDTDQIIPARYLKTTDKAGPCALLRLAVQRRGATPSAFRAESSSLAGRAGATGR
jgi:hypothetical protein